MDNQGLFDMNEQLLEIIEDNSSLTKQQEADLLNRTKKLSIGYLKHICKQAAKRSMLYTVHTIQYLVFSMLEYIHEKQTKNHTHFREKIAQQLASFLTFLQKHSHTWFNIDTAMPHYLWLPIHAALKDYFQEGEKFLLQETELELVIIIQDIYQLTTANPTPTYRQSTYWQKLSQELSTHSSDPLNNHTKTVYHLLRFNFNHPRFIQYVFNSYLKAATDTDNNKTHWQQAFQHINRIVPESDLILLPDANGCKKVRLRMIYNEINAAQFNKETAAIFQSNHPYAYNLSVAQLAVALRMQVESGMLQADNVSEMLRHIATQTLTRKNTTISIKSLYNHYHQPERAAVQIMMEYNTRMRNVLMGLLEG